MKVLITGGHGFLGQWIAQACLSAKYSVDLLNSDLTDCESLILEVIKSDPDFILHFGGISHPLECEKNYEKAVGVNVKGTEHIARASELLKKKVHIFFASTAQVYDKPSDLEILNGVKFSEGRKVNPQNQYANTKAQAEEVLLKASHGNVIVTILRLFNVSHRSQSTRFVLPYLYQNLIENKGNEEKSITVGNLDVLRDFSSVYEFLEVILLLLKKEPVEVSQCFNVCSGKARRILDLAYIMAEKMEVKHPIFIRDESRIRPGEPRAIWGDPEKLNNYLNRGSAPLSDIEFIERFLR